MKLNCEWELIEGRDWLELSLRAFIGAVTGNGVKRGRAALVKGRIVASQIGSWKRF